MDLQVTDDELRRSSEGQRTTDLRRSASGIVLEPQPTSDPADPLNWPMWRKVMTLAIVTSSAFIALAEATANQTGFVFQAELYRKTPVEISYGVCHRHTVTLYLHVY
jgi:hypothetical protein